MSTVLKVKRKRLEKKRMETATPPKKKRRKMSIYWTPKTIRKTFERGRAGRKRDENELRVVENNLVAFQILAVTAEPLDRDAGIGRPKRRERTARLGYYPLVSREKRLNPRYLTGCQFFCLADII